MMRLTRLGRERNVLLHPCCSLAGRKCRHQEQGKQFTTGLVMEAVYDVSIQRLPEGLRMSCETHGSRDKAQTANAQRHRRRKVPTRGERSCDELSSNRRRRSCTFRPHLSLVSRVKGHSLVWSRIVAGALAGRRAGAGPSDVPPPPETPVAPLVAHPTALFHRSAFARRFGERR